MTAQQLKSSILQMAVQGKLVPQNPNDEPASVLLERIKAEKQELIRQGKIKKDKKKSDVIKMDEVPFEIPDSWKWVRLKNIVNVVSARRVHQSDWQTSGIPFYRAREISSLADNGYVDNELFITQELYDEFSKNGVPKENDLMITAVGTLGKTYIVKSTDKFYYKDASVISLENYGNINPYYLKLVIESPFLKQIIKEFSSGTTVGTITIVRANEYLIPLPPLEEQKRIVAKIEELLPYIEAYEKAETQLTALNKSFPEMLKKSILQEAVQGKLVPQNPDDEPASVLLERIRTEKHELIKAGKIKKDKKKSDVIKMDEVPFEIPDSWEWVRLGDLFHLIMGQSPKGDKVFETGNGIEFHQGKVFFGEKFIKESNQITNEPTKIAPENSVLLCVRAPVGKVNITQREICIGRGLCAILPLGSITVNFVYYLLETYEQTFIKQATGTTFISITGEIIKNQLIPLPPLAEQHRIVEKIEELMKYCDIL